MQAQENPMPTPYHEAENNKEAVRRFNTEVIGRGDAAAFAALMAPDFVNHSAPPGAPTGSDGM